jgi:ferredoxin/flavodoxin---NADP+ reductase
MSQLGTEARPLRVAIIGAGPAGLYTADALLKKKELHCSIDIFNHLPTPYGLVRDGVAPDHQSIKAVTRVFERILEQPNVRYFGNVTFGTDVHHEELKELYDQIVYATGAQSDRRMGIEGEDLAGSYPATAFVGWYNGHPHYRDHEVDLSHERVVVVGNGNVAMDVARILLKSPDELAQTDMADHAIEVLRGSKVREVVMLGRRGPVQSAFTNAELKEFGELEDVNVVVDPAELELDPASQEALAGDKVAEKNLATLRGYAERGEQHGSRTLRMRFLVSPVKILGDGGKVAAVKLERNKLVMSDMGTLRAKGTGEYETIEAGLILRAVGYRSLPLMGVPFDESTATISNIAGRVITDATGEPVGGEYCVGWAKRGPSGVIGTNKADAVATVASMVEDVPELPGIEDANRDPANIVALIEERVPNYVNYEAWRCLDRYETSRGTEQGRPRVKVTNVEEMLGIIEQQMAAN